MVTNYTTKCYIKSGSENASRKPLFLYTKIHIYTKFNTPKNSPSFLPLRLLYLFRDFLLTFSLAVRPDGKRSAYKISKIDTCVLLVILSYF